MISRFLPKLAVNFQQIRNMKVIAIPANQDNYQYLIIDENTNVSAIVDPVEVDLVLKTAKAERSTLSVALVTHHHWDHAGGTETLSKALNGLEIYGGDAKRIAAISKVLDHGAEFKVGDLDVKAISTPCHTNTHICYYVTDKAKNERAVFTGDTLFIGGCGRFFEGTAEQMNQALNVHLSSLPNDTKVYCGHEYTVANLKFAVTLDSSAAVTEKLNWAQKQREKNKFTIPSTIGEEKSFNLFMKVNDAKLQKALGVTSPVDAMAKLREMKNSFQG